MIITIFMIAIALSMDAFSLSLLYGTLGMKNKQRIALSTIVGIYHLLMPITGYLIGKQVLSLLPIKTNVVVGIIFLIIGLEMLASVNKEEIVTELKTIKTFLLFGFTVSIDSLSIGITLTSISNNILVPPIIFALTSSIFTYVGISIGKVLNKNFGKYSILLGSIILIILAIFYLFS